MAELFQELLEWVAQNPFWAYLIVFLVAFSESMAIVGLIVPGVVLMFGVGALITTGTLGFWPVFAWAVAGAVAGDGLSFWLGYHFRDRLSHMWPFNRYPDSLNKGVVFFQRYGGKSVAFGRFVGPVRAVIPLVAGMMAMAPWRFVVANLLSALAWAPAYLLPGMVFGASLELAAEVAFRLVLLLVLLLLAIWFVIWLVRNLFRLLSARASRWLQALLHWSQVHPKAGEIAMALADPQHPDAKGLAMLAALLVLTTALFGLVTGVVLGGEWVTALNHLVLEGLQSLHTPFADHLMATFSRLADLAVILPLILVVLVFLIWRGYHRTAGYWLAAAAFALTASIALKYILQVPRPDLAIPGLTAYAFPSTHVLRATVLYGFLAVAAARGIPLRWRWLPFGLAASLITAVSVARLYFGVHWLTDVVGSLSLGLAWIAALGIAYRRHTKLEAHWQGLLLTALVTLVLAFATQSLRRHNVDVQHYQPAVPVTEISRALWQDAGWKALPEAREDLRELGDHPMNLQYAGALIAVQERLAARGWEPAPMLGWHNALKLLSPSLALSALPVLPQVHAGRHEAMVLVKSLPQNGRLVLRLWPTTIRLAPNGAALWLGNVTAQEQLALLGLLNFPVTRSDFQEPFLVLRHDLAALDPLQPDPSRDLLLVSAPP